MTETELEDVKEKLAILEVRASYSSFLEQYLSLGNMQGESLRVTVLRRIHWLETQNERLEEVLIKYAYLFFLITDPYADFQGCET